MNLPNDKKNINAQLDNVNLKLNNSVHTTQIQYYFYGNLPSVFGLRLNSFRFVKAKVISFELREQKQKHCSNKKQQYFDN